MQFCRFFKTLFKFISFLIYSLPLTIIHELLLGFESSLNLLVSETLHITQKEVCS